MFWIFTNGPNKVIFTFQFSNKDNMYREYKQIKKSLVNDKQLAALTPYLVQVG